MPSDKLPVAIGGPALRAAALAGDPSAAYEVAVRFAEGRVVPPNNEEAARWFERAAKKGLAPGAIPAWRALRKRRRREERPCRSARPLPRRRRQRSRQGHAQSRRPLCRRHRRRGGLSQCRCNGSARPPSAALPTANLISPSFMRAALASSRISRRPTSGSSLAAKEGDKDAAQKRDEMAGHLDEQALTAARLAAQTFTPLPQPADAVTVKGAWDPPATGAPPAKTKPRSAKAAARYRQGQLISVRHAEAVANGPAEAAGDRRRGIEGCTVQSNRSNLRAGRRSTVCPAASRG